MVYGRLSRQMRRKGLRRFTQFRELIESDEQERIHFINTLTTNKQNFSVRAIILNLLKKYWFQSGVKSG